MFDPDTGGLVEIPEPTIYLPNEHARQEAEAWQEEKNDKAKQNQRRQIQAMLPSTMAPIHPKTRDQLNELRHLADSAQKTKTKRKAQKQARKKNRKK